MSRYRSRYFKRPAEPAVSVESAIADFLMYHEREGDSRPYLAELKSYLVGGCGRYGKKRSWKPLVPWAAERGWSLLQDLNGERLGAYLDDVRRSSTRGDYGKACVMLKRFLTHCVHATHLRQMPLEIPYQRRLRAEINVFTPTEVARIHEIVTKENVRDRAIFMLLLDTGMRASEVCSLRLDDFRWERREVAIRAEVAKNRHARIIPLGASIPDLRRYLTARGMDQARCDAFFLAFYSTPAFSDIVSLQRILGHSRLDVTERYLRLLSSDIAEQHSRFSPAPTFQGHSPKSDRCPARSHLVR